MICKLRPNIFVDQLLFSLTRTSMSPSSLIPKKLSLLIKNKLTLPDEISKSLNSLPSSVSKYS